MIMNKKPIEERAKILQCLIEGNSIRSTARLMNCSKNTVSKLLVDVGRACGWYQDQKMLHLPCIRVQVDEIWSFVNKKQKNLKYDSDEEGDVWTWVAICADTKLVPVWSVGPRSAEMAKSFIGDLAYRIPHRIQITSDGLPFYKDAVEEAFGADVDFAMLVKTVNEKEKELDIKTRRITGSPSERHISTSFVERQNLTMRMGIRRFTRKTNAFSKKIENHMYSISLHFMYYNFVRIHQTLKVTPAMEAGITDKLWSLEDVAILAENYENVTTIKNAPE